MIKLIIFDIDGILTDDTVIIDDTGREQKRMNFKDVDAMYELHRVGFQLAAITGEGNAMAEYFRGRFPWDYFYSNNKQKKETVKRLSEEISMPLEEICFIGEGKYDVEVLSYVGLGICPSDAIDRAKEASDIILNNRGGDGCVWELIGILERYNSGNKLACSFVDKLREHAECYKKMAADKEMINAAIHMGRIMKDLLLKKKQVFLCGYEGSEISAQNMTFELSEQLCGELSVKCVKQWDIMEGEALGESALPGDLFVLLFTGELSTTLMDILGHAKKAGMVTAALTNADIHWKRKEIVDIHIPASGKTYSQIREGHMAVWNLIVDNLI